MNISKLIGLDERVNNLIEDALREYSPGLACDLQKVTERIDAFQDDTYSNMQQIEQQKYRMVELETKLDNLAVFVKLHLPGGGD